MALNPATLASDMASAVGVTNAAAQASYLALATAIIAHFVSHGVITTADTVPATGLISPGGLSPAPVTGTVIGATGVGTIA